MQISIGELPQLGIITVPDNLGEQELEDYVRRTYGHLLTPISIPIKDIDPASIDIDASTDQSQTGLSSIISSPDRKIDTTGFVDKTTAIDDGTALGRGLSSGWSGFTTALGTTFKLGLPGLVEEATGLDTVNRQDVADRYAQISKDARANKATTTWANVSETFDKDGVGSGLDRLLTFTGEQLGRSLPYMGPTIAGIAGGAALGQAFLPIPVVGALVGGIFAGAATFFGMNLERQIETKYAETGEIPSDQELGYAAAAATSIPQAALDAVTIIALGPAARAIRFAAPSRREALRITANQLKNKTAKELSAARVSLGKTLAEQIPKGMALGIATEGPTEVFQQALERLQAGLPVDPEDAEAFNEYLESLVAGGLLGGLFGVGGGSYHGLTKQQRMQKAMKPFKERVDALKRNEVTQQEINQAILHGYEDKTSGKVYNGWKGLNLLYNEKARPTIKKLESATAEEVLAGEKGRTGELEAATYDRVGFIPDRTKDEKVIIKDEEQEFDDSINTELDRSSFVEETGKEFSEGLAEASASIENLRSKKQSAEKELVNLKLPTNKKELAVTKEELLTDPQETPENVTKLAAIDNFENTSTALFETEKDYVTTLENEIANQQKLEREREIQLSEVEEVTPEIRDTLKNKNINTVNQLYPYSSVEIREDILPEHNLTKEQADRLVISAREKAGIIFKPTDSEKRRQDLAQENIKTAPIGKPLEDLSPLTARKDIKEDRFFIDTDSRKGRNVINKAKEKVKSERKKAEKEGIPRDKIDQVPAVQQAMKDHQDALKKYRGIITVPDEKIIDTEEVTTEDEKKVVTKGKPLDDLNKIEIEYTDKKGNPEKFSLQHYNEPQRAIQIEGLKKWLRERGVPEQEMSLERLKEEIELSLPRDINQKTGKWQDADYRDAPDSRGRRTKKFGKRRSNIYDVLNVVGKPYKFSVDTTFPNKGIIPLIDEYNPNDYVSPRELADSISSTEATTEEEFTENLRKKLGHQEKIVDVQDTKGKVVSKVPISEIVQTKGVTEIRRKELEDGAANSVDPVTSTSMLNFLLDESGFMNPTREVKFGIFNGRPFIRFILNDATWRYTPRKRDRKTGEPQEWSEQEIEEGKDKYILGGTPVNLYEKDISSPTSKINFVKNNAPFFNVKKAYYMDEKGMFHLYPNISKMITTYNRAVFLEANERGVKFDSKPDTIPFDETLQEMSDRFQAEADRSPEGVEAFWNERRKVIRQGEVINEFEINEELRKAGYKEWSREAVETLNKNEKDVKEEVVLESVTAEQRSKDVKLRDIWIKAKENIKERTDAKANTERFTISEVNQLAEAKKKGLYETTITPEEIKDIEKRANIHFQNERRRKEAGRRRDKPIDTGREGLSYEEKKRALVEAGILTELEVDFTSITDPIERTEEINKIKNLYDDQFVTPTKEIEGETNPNEDTIDAAAAEKNLNPKDIGERIPLNMWERRNIVEWIADKTGGTVQTIFMSVEELRKLWAAKGGDKNLTDKVMAFTDPISRLIVLAENSQFDLPHSRMSALWLAGEEAFHMVDRLALTEEERSVLDEVLTPELAEANNIEVKQYAKNKQQLEIRAKVMAAYMAGANIKGLTSPARKVMYKIKNFVNRLFKYLRAGEWQLTPEQRTLKAMEDFKNGKLAERVGAAPNVEERTLIAGQGLEASITGEKLKKGAEEAFNDVKSTKELTNRGEVLSKWNKWITHLSGLAGKYPSFRVFYNAHQKEVELRNKFKNMSLENLKDFMDLTMASLPYGKRKREAQRILTEVERFVVIGDYLNLDINEVRALGYVIDLKSYPNLPFKDTLTNIKATNIYEELDELSEAEVQEQLELRKEGRKVRGKKIGVKIADTDAYQLKQLGLTGQEEIKLSKDGIKAFESYVKTVQGAYSQAKRGFVKSLIDDGYIIFKDLALGKRNVALEMSWRGRPPINYLDLNESISDLFPRITEWLNQFVKKDEKGEAISFEKAIEEPSEPPLPTKRKLTKNERQRFNRAKKRHKEAGYGLDAVPREEHFITKTKEQREALKEYNQKIHDISRYKRDLERLLKSDKFGGEGKLKSIKALYNKMVKFEKAFSTLREIENKMYVPRYRLGGYAVYITKKNYNKKGELLKKVTPVMLRPVPTLRKRAIGFEKRASVQEKRRAEKLAKQLKEDFPEEAGYEINVTQMDIDKLFPSTELNISDQRTVLRQVLPKIDAALLSLAHFNSNPNLKDKLEKSGPKGRSDMIVDLLRDIHDMAGQRAFEKFTTKRMQPPVVGYINEDNNNGSFLTTGLEQYVNSSANISSSLWQQSAISNSFDGLQKAGQRGLHKYALESWNYFNTFKAQDEALRAYAFHMYLGLNLSSSALNLLQIPQSTFPIFSSVYGIARTVGSLAKAVTDSIRLLDVLGKDAASLGDYGFNFNKKKPTRFSQGEWDMLKILNHAGTIQPIQNMDLAGEYFGETGGLQKYGYPRRMLFAMAWAFGVTENINRVATALSSYRMTQANLKDAKIRRRTKHFARHTRFAPFYKIIEDGPRHGAATPRSGLLLAEEEEKLPYFLRDMTKDEQFALLTTQMMVEKSQFVMGKQNRPGLFRNLFGNSTIAGLATQFQSYQFQMMENWSGAFQKALTGRFGFEERILDEEGNVIQPFGTPSKLSGEERLMALKQGTLMTAGLVAFAGSVGLPFADDVNELLKIMTRNLGEGVEEDYFKEARDYLNEIFGSDIAESIMYGPLTRGLLKPLDLDIDLSRRGGLGSLIPFMRALTGTPAPQVMVGPAGSRIAEWAREAHRTMTDPSVPIQLKVYSLLSLAIPVSISKMVNTFSQVPTKGFTTRGGMTVVPPDEVGWQQSVTNMLGFTPGKVAREWEKRGVARYHEYRSRPGKERYTNAIARLMTNSIENKDPDAWNRAMELIRDIINHDTQQISIGDYSAMYSINLDTIIERVMKNLYPQMALTAGIPRRVRGQIFKETTAIQ